MSGRSQTPRTTRSRGQTPLPALATRQSHAYGASGKAALADQVNTTTDFQQAFTTTRLRSSTRAPSQESAVPPSAMPASVMPASVMPVSAKPSAKSAVPAPAKRGRKPKTPAPIVEEEPIFDEEPANEDDLELEDDHPPMLNGFPSNSASRPRPAGSSRDDARPSTSLQNSALYIAAQRAQRAQRAQQPPPPPSRPVQRPSSSGDQPAPAQQFQPSSLLVKILLGLVVFAVFPALFYLNLVVFSRIPLPAGAHLARQEFLTKVNWLLHDHTTNVTSPELSASWRQFTWERTFAGQVNYSDVSELQPHINDLFVYALTRNENATLLLNKTVVGMQAEIDELKALVPLLAVRQDAHGEWQMPPHFWSALVDKVWRERHELGIWHNMAVLNTAKAMGEVNYASVKMGALIDPHLTSPTKQPSASWTFRAVGLLWGHRVQPNPPSAALASWSEANDCWCSSPSADLGVRLSHTIRPTELTIEHIPSTGTREIAAAPKEFELWAEMADKEEAKRVQAVLDDSYFPFDDTRPCATTAPSKKWVCLFAGTYQIHRPNPVQSFKLWSDYHALDITTKKIVVRAVNNWGADHTCFYRVRVTGEEPRIEQVE